MKKSTTGNEFIWIMVAMIVLFIAGLVYNALSFNIY